ncbi:hypothetical protein VOLCADRAFT_88606 [Volvox carteri f. nagariensis]|uniref:AAA+ ATPase domain-containing protein n=1 Tax=Volvox carteri f. nagariensis TaxID=3068 RepID=D8TPG3_VOLCA|nr:uncharacterized protein VOLCADRAFT_88606 [Volvox carteri f. nagariensis]EFJ50613.1 hypothetical protein VOLCADRAFT_88606 [Volvox carteri f. nagariensis]|eukprot:XP_002948206.1 hypothetical protein VOLCADRAFT_88606 [Volvox carteri f. nagariensis]
MHGTPHWVAVEAEAGAVDGHTSGNAAAAAAGVSCRRRHRSSGAPPRPPTPADASGIGGGAAAVEGTDADASVKEEVRMSLLLPLRMPHLFQGIRQPASNFLLYGPPGTGKTMLVERIAAEAGATLLVLTPGAILSKWSGESEKQLRAVFEVARVKQPCIVFMDEVDSLAPTRGSGDDPIGRRLLNELLVQMSCLASSSSSSGPGETPGGLLKAADARATAVAGKEARTSATTAAVATATAVAAVTSSARDRGTGNGAGGGAGGVGLGTCSPTGVYVFAATNRIQDCDPALLRRFDRRVAVPLPDLAAREAFLAAVLTRPELAGQHSLDSGEVRQLAERTAGYSGSDLTQLCREAVMQPVRELLRQMAAAGAWGWGGGGDGGGGGGGGAVVAGPRPLALRDFEWALGEIQPVAL